MPRPMSVVQCQQFLGKVVVQPFVSHNRKWLHVSASVGGNCTDIPALVPRLLEPYT